MVRVAPKKKRRVLSRRGDVMLFVRTVGSDAPVAPQPSQQQKRLPIKEEPDFCFSKKTDGLVLRTAGTNLIHTKELLEEVDDFEEEACYAALVTVAGAIVGRV